MKPLHVLSLSSFLLFTACSQQPPAESATQTGAPPSDVQSQPAEPSAGTPAEAAKVASATGTVESIDTAAGKITLAHGPVEALGWPEMTMAFKATPEQLAAAKPGQKVRFEFQNTGAEATITRIEPNE